MSRNILRATAWWWVAVSFPVGMGSVFLPKPMEIKPLNEMRQEGKGAKGKEKSSRGVFYLFQTDGIW